ncbi:penicillin acylase family protein [bacterium]|nr:penicillin acylase family protein [bacterium]
MKSIRLLIPVFALLAQFPLCANTFEFLTAPDGSRVEVMRDDYGVPHITADNEAAVFFGQGYTIAQDRLFMMDKFARTGRGRYGEIRGQAVAHVVDVEWRRRGLSPDDIEALHDTLSPELMNVLEAYTAGVNTWIDSVRNDPERLMPVEYAEAPLEDWTPDKCLGASLYMARLFGSGGGFELDRLLELQEHGQEWFDENRPINDPTAPTTIINGSPPEPRTWHYSGRQVHQEAVHPIQEWRNLVQYTMESEGLPTTFGSFALTMLPERTTANSTMLYGAPQMSIPEPGNVNRGAELEVTCPTIHMAGMQFPGVPGVLIGRSESLAWTFCSGKSDNKDIYIDSLQLTDRTRYLYNGEWRPMETIDDTIHSYDANYFIRRHYRTLHGPVLGYDFPNNYAFTMKEGMYGREHLMIYMNIRTNRATTVEEFRDALVGIPYSFNITYCDSDGQIGYVHIGQYHDRSDGVDPRLPHFGDGSEEWGDFLSFDDLPQATGADQDYFANWNNKPAPWWDNSDEVYWVGNDHVTQIFDFITSEALHSFEHLESLDEVLDRQGSYTEMISWEDDNHALSLGAPGQSGFLSLDSIPSPHYNDQYEMFLEHEHKPWLFGPSWTDVPQRRVTVPGGFSLDTIYPNPFNGMTRVQLTLHQRGSVKLALFDILGRQVWSSHLPDATPGSHHLTLDLEGRASGLYVLRSSVNNSPEQLRKLILVR